MRHLFFVLALAACGGNSGGGGGGVDGPPAANSGFVTIQSYTAMQPPGTSVTGGAATASFYTGHGPCTTMQTLGACQVRTCDFTTMSPRVSAGTITVTGTATPVTLSPAADKTYMQFMQTQVLFSGGESLTVAGSGADVPAFTATVTASAKSTITSPAKPPSSSPFLVVNRAQDLTVTWTGGGSGQQLVYLDGGTNRATSLFCHFAASAGTGTIPASTLAAIPAGSGGFGMGAVADKTATAGDWAVDVETYYNSVWPDDSIVSGPTTYQ